jgi:hypothetical protein
LSNSTTNKNNCDKFRPDKEYTKLQVFLDNLPYILMAIIGAAINLHIFKFSTLGFMLSFLYIAYSAIGAIWIMIFVCPYCNILIQIFAPVVMDKSLQSFGIKVPKICFQKNSKNIFRSLFRCGFFP